MADIAGRGFVAGLVKGVRQADPADAWFHTGGDLWLLDGGTNPHVLRGIGGEDVFGFSFGLQRHCSEWTGAPLVMAPVKGRGGIEAGEVVAYRLFGPDPIVFDQSLVARFGARANNIETVLYSYLDATAPPAPDPAPTLEWEIAGPFECCSREDFDKPEYPEAPRASWAETHQPAFGPYAGEAPFILPGAMPCASERGWIDFTRLLRAPGRTNVGTQPAEVSAYARTRLDAPSDGRAILRFGFDDWIKVWVNGDLLLDREHDEGFQTADTPPVALRKGANEILVKLSNFDNLEWRVWAFSLGVEAFG